jgi:hypothetical protein
MLGSNYMTLNGVSLPNPKDGITISYQNIERTAQSEAGTDLAVVTRLKKRTFSWTAYVTSEWKAKYETICGLTQCTFVFNSETITVRARISGATMSPDSEYADRTNGLWTLGIQLIEV